MGDFSRFNATTHISPLLTTPALGGGSQTPKVSQASIAALSPQAKKAAKQFESYYVQQFLNLTAPPVDKDSMFSGGFGEELFRQQLNQNIADNIADRGGFGLANKILGQMAQKQAAAAYTATNNATTH